MDDVAINMNDCPLDVDVGFVVDGFDVSLSMMIVKLLSIVMSMLLIQRLIVMSISMLMIFLVKFRL